MANVPTRIATASSIASPADAANELDRELRRKLGDAAPVVVFLFASTQQPLAEIAPRVARSFPEAVILGASTAGEFTERGDAKGSVVACAVAGEFRVFAGIAQDLREGGAEAVATATRKLPSVVDGYPHATAIVLLDPLAGNSEAVTLEVAGALADGGVIAGGAAGDDVQMKQTFVSLGTEVHPNALVVARIFSKAALGVGVAHAHRPLSGPLRVTRADGPIVIEIEGRPAWDVWRDATRSAAAAQAIDVDALSAEDEGPFLLRYEAGLASGSGFTIRAPLARVTNAIRFATEIPEGAVIRITESSAESQVASARAAAKRACDDLGQVPIAGAVVFDCICRKLILGDDFVRAVREISNELGGAPLAGFETYGEIALTPDDVSGFHNTTSVVIAFPAT